MAISITRFRIEGLHGKWTFDIPIEDNKLILVGENGTGKSTVANIIFFFITEQWERLFKYEFKKILAVINGDEMTLSKGDRVQSQLFELSFLLRKAHLSENFMIDELTKKTKQLKHAGLSGPEISRYLSGEDVSSSILKNDHLKEGENLDKLSQSIAGKILFLPTYRRIEQELSEIFEEEGETIKKIEKSFQVAATGEKYIKLIQFGMEDVIGLIAKRTSELKDLIRRELSNLSGVFLKNIIKGDYKKHEIVKIKNINIEKIEPIFKIMDESILSEREKNRLISKVKELQRASDVDSKSVTEFKLIASYLVELIRLEEQQERNEKDLVKFTEVVNSYLVDKVMVYDRINYEIKIVEKKYVKRKPSKEGKEISLKSLSSGEKQIVSLFAHLYLSGVEKYFLIIDEPELSISVPWQMKLLPDILNTGRCEGVIAATHSPFIFDNELKDYTHSLEEFRETAL